jgi:mono/diheme cytochrome c family protein
VLPSQYDGLTQLTVPFVVMTALGQVVFAFNLVQTLRGKVLARRETVLRSLGFTASLAGAAALLAGSALALDREGAGESPERPALGAAGGRSDAAAQEAFVSSCGSCHALQAAGTTGRVGPDLDQLRPDAARVLQAIERGGAGSGTMPPALLQGEDAEHVSDYVAEVAGGP